MWNSRKVGDSLYNAGAYGGEIAHVLPVLSDLTKEGEIETLSAKDLAFGYRLFSHSSIRSSCPILLSLP